VLVKNSDNPVGTLRLRFEPIFSYSLEIKTTTMANAEASFDLLSQEIKLDLSLSPENRNHKFSNATLALFKQYNLGQVEHDLWRESHMLEEMQEILNQRFLALNPHLSRLTNMSISSLESAFKYEQEVDETGLTEFQRDAAARTRHPNLDRESLELLAADNYIFKKQGIRPASAELNAEADQNECKEKDINTNPILSWRELVEELKPHHINADALNKAVAASVKKNYGRKKPPWQLASCGKGYSIVETGEKFKDKKNHPTPAVCKYQKDIQDRII
jgi:hypothetical protein